MRITTKTDYAVIILTALAKKKNMPISLEKISEHTGVSEAYLQRIAARLKKHHLIKAKRGAFGGYLLKKPAEKINLLKMVEAVGDDIHCGRCTNLKSDPCPFQENCERHPGWAKFQAKISDIFAQQTVADMISKHESK